MSKIRDKVTTAVKRQKAEAVALDRATKLASDAHTRDFAAVAKAAGAQAGETARFSRTKPAERLPGDVQLAALQSSAGTITTPLKSPLCAIRKVCSWRSCGLLAPCAWAFCAHSLDLAQFFICE